MILKALTVGFIATNCYIVGSDTTRRTMVIDPGADPRAIMKAIDADRLLLSMIVITHSHFDHTGAVKAIKDATGARFAVGAGAEKSSPGAFIKLVAAMSGGSARIPEPDLFLSDGDKIDIDDLHFEVIYTPGHSPDEISLYGHGILFSGDTLFNAGIGRTDFPGCSYEQLEHSIQTRLYTLPDQTIVYPGHGPRLQSGVKKGAIPLSGDCPFI